MMYFATFSGDVDGPVTMGELRRRSAAGRLDFFSLTTAPDDWLTPDELDATAEISATAAPSASGWSGAALSHAPSSEFWKSKPVVVKPKSRASYILLALCFGILGIHNFYARRTSRAWVQLILVVLLIGLLINPLWVLVEICVVREDGDGNAMTW